LDNHYFELGLNTPWMNASGFGGYLPQHNTEDLVPLGGFVTNPVSLLPRSPSLTRSVISYPGGFMLHTGIPNPGIKNVLKTYAKKWTNLAVPLWVHLMATTPYEVQTMVRQLEETQSVSAVELGLPFDASAKNQYALIEAAAGELPFFVCIPLDRIEPVLIEKIASLGADGVVISAPRGMMVIDGKCKQGRLYGPALHPQMLATLHRLRGLSLPLIAGCGIFSKEQGEAALEAGAAALQVDAWMWTF
jgi:dihydroorotate dehydrogenase (NAD+) catalytic subunit